MSSNRIRSAQNKARRGENSNDLISEMPNDILHSILSFLPLQDVVMTANLSTRWRYVWCHMKDLHLQDEQALNRITRNWRVRGAEEAMFIKNINNVIWRYKGTPIREFRIRFDLDNYYRDTINKWVRFAFSNVAKMIELDFSHSNGRIRQPNLNYRFQKYVIDEQASFTLKWPTMNVVIMPIPFLQKLVLKCVNVNDEMLEIFLECCLVLETLSIIGSGEFTRVEAIRQSLTLKNLDISCCPRVVAIVLRDFNLETFSYSGQLVDLTLVNLPKLEELYIGNGHLGFDNKLFSRNLMCFSNVQILTFDVSHPSQNVKDLQIPELPKVKKLTLKLGARGDDSLLDYTILAKACPLMETFTIELIWYSPLKKRKVIHKAANHPYCYLKTLKIEGFFGRISDLELAAYFIDNAPELNKIIIDPSYKLPNNAPQNPENICRQVAAARSAATRRLPPITPGGIKLVIL